MRLIAISFGISPSAREIIENIGKNIFESEIKIIDLKTSEPDLTPTDRVLLFGKKAARLFSGAANQTIQKLPELSQLEEGNETTRKETYELLLSFRDQIKNQQILTPEDLPTTDIPTIEQVLKENSKWIGKTKNGKSIEIQRTPQESKADIAITFAELFALKSAIDVLDIDELIIN